MLSLLILILLTIILLLQMQDDFKTRHLSLWSIFALAGLSIAYAFQCLSWQNILLFTSINVTFIIIQIAVVWGYLRLRHQQKIQLTQDYLGLGDILFWLAICPLAHPSTFVIAHSILLVGVLLLAFLFKQKNIPLAGWYALLMLPPLWFQHLTNHCTNYQPLLN